MRDPERLLSASSDADAFERELLTSLRAEAAPPHARRALWQGIAAGLAAAAPASVAGASAAAGGGGVASALSSKGSALFLAKWAAAFALGAGAASGAYWVSQREPSPAVEASKVVQPKAAAAPVRAPEPVAAPEPAVQVVPAPQLPSPPGVKRVPPSSLAAESELLREARAQLRAGDLTAAERSLSLQRKRFPRGVLGQERDVLQIELLRARGDDARARALANRFLRAHPESPHAAQLRSLVAAP